MLTPDLSVCCADVCVRWTDWPPCVAGVVLYTFLHFHSTSAITTSVFLGLGILFCGGATAHNIAVWHRVSHSDATGRNGDCTGWIGLGGTVTGLDGTVTELGGTVAGLSG